MKGELTQARVTGVKDEPHEEYPRLHVTVEDEPGYQGKAQYLELEIGGKGYERAKADIGPGAVISGQVEVTSRYWDKGDKWFTTARLFGWNVDEYPKAEEPTGDDDPNAEIPF